MIGRVELSGILFRPDDDLLWWTIVSSVSHMRPCEGEEMGKIARNAGSMTVSKTCVMAVSRMCEVDERVKVKDKPFRCIG